MRILKEKFEEIKKKGYIKSSREGSTGIGKTFEDLIGKPEDHEETPDFQGIEIKTKGDNNIDEYITLFCATPRGPHDYEIHYLVDKYGYPDVISKEKKVLNRSIYSGTLRGSRYLFALKLDCRKQIVKLRILDNYLKLIEDEIYWTYYDLETKLYRKHRYLALVKATKKIINGSTYYKYHDIRFYKIRNFDSFIELIANGKIRVNFRIGIYRSGKREGTMHDRGTAFQIRESDLLQLFDEIDISKFGAK